MHYWLVSCEGVFWIRKFNNEEDAMKAFDTVECKRILIYGEVLKEET